MAELTLEKITLRMARFMGWDATDWPTEITPAMVVNEAVQSVYNAVEWNFLQGASVDLDLVQDQTWIALPADFGSTGEEDLTSQSFAYFALQLRTMQHVQLARQVGVAPGAGAYAGCIVFEDTDTSDTPTPRIEIAPTPTEDAAAAFQLSYRRRFAPVTDPSDVCQVPVFMQPLVIRACCLWLAGYEADASSPTALEDFMDRLQASSLWMNAISQDANTQQGVGMWAGGAASQNDDEVVPLGLPIGRVPTIV